MKGCSRGNPGWLGERLGSAWTCIALLVALGLVFLTGSIVEAAPAGDQTANVPPVVYVGSGTTIQEGQSASWYGGFTDSDSSSWTATVDYGDGSGPRPLALTGQSFLVSPGYKDNGTYTIKVAVTDDGGAFGVGSAVMTVYNVAPKANFEVPVDADAGDPVPLALTNVVDPSELDVAAGFHYSFACDGLLSSLATSYAAAGTSGTGSCTFNDAGKFTVWGRVFDKDDGSATYSRVVTVNASPVVTPASDQTVEEGESASINLGSFTAPASGGPWSVDVDWGDGSQHAVLTVSAVGSLGQQSHIYADDDSYTVGVKVADKVGRWGSAGFQVVVTNVAPVIGAITIPVDPTQLGSAVNVSAAFTDVGTKDTHTAAWDWGDGTTSDSEGVITETNGSGSASGAHSYAGAGVYAIKVTIADKDDGKDSRTSLQNIVIYDPSAGFVTGGGWINSPAAACKLAEACGTASGKANFGFVSKYQKDATVPSGGTEFQFQIGTLDFYSGSYEWLVIVGSKAQFQGVGTINGKGDYGFALTAVDGDVEGGDGVDGFRIAIWDRANGDAVIYDNQTDGSETTVPAPELGGGSITIHTDKR